jgi:hypothetical protein
MKKETRGNNLTMAEMAIAIDVSVCRRGEYDMG